MKIIWKRRRFEENPLKKITRQVVGISRRYLNNITNAAYWDQKWKVGFFVEGIDENGKPAMVLVTYYDKNHDPEPFRHLGNPWVSVYKIGEERDQKSDWHTTFYNLPEYEFAMQSICFHMNYNERSPYLGLFHKDFKPKVVK